MEIHVHLARLDLPFGSSSLRSGSLGNSQDLIQLKAHTSGDSFGSSPSRYARSCNPRRQQSVVSVRAVQNGRAQESKLGIVSSDGSARFLRSSTWGQNGCRERGHAAYRKPGGSWVRSFVDEATATSTDVEVNTQIESPERVDEEVDEIEVGRESEQQGQPSAAGVSEAQVRLRELQKEWDQEVEGRDDDTENSESDASSSDEYNYEDMRLGEEQEWNEDELKKMDVLKSFEYQHADKRGHFIVKAMRVHQMRIIQELLVDSFSELIGGLFAYRPLLSLTVRQYMRDRYVCLPNAVTLVGFYAPQESNIDMESLAENGFPTAEKWVMAGTVELAFCDLEQADKPAGPAPPRDSPYLCNMAVSSPFRRRGLGRQLLKAAKELTVMMGKEDLYLHCRMIDYAPLNMYQGAGFQIIATDSILTLLAFQRRRHLLHKRIAPTLST